MEGLRADSRLGDLGYRIQSYAENNGYSVVRELVGHGVGKELHEDPSVPNYGIENRGIRLKAGMTIAVEPMINMGKQFVRVDPDRWTVRTADGMPSAHYETTLIILSTA
jgi:methionyl aminopeptidase